MSKGIGKEFMRKTTYEYLEASDQSRGLPQPPLVEPYEGTGSIVELPRPGELEARPVDLTQAIEERTSLRKYRDDPLSLADLSYLLWVTQGVKMTTSRPVTLRTVPSAGARHALETYLLVNRVEGLEPGLYRFLPIEHKLVAVELGPDLADRVAHVALNQNIVRTGAVTFIWTAVIYRMYWRYGERGYRYLHLDAGHVCQNLYLAAAAVDCGVCAIGAFSDNDLNSLLGLDGENQFAVYMAALGKKQPTA